MDSCFGPRKPQDFGRQSFVDQSKIDLFRDGLVHMSLVLDPV